MFPRYREVKLSKNSVTVISLYVSAGQCRQTSCIMSSINLHTLEEWWKRLTMHLVWLKYHLLKNPYGFCNFEFAGSTLCVKPFFIFIISVNYHLYDSNNPRKPCKKMSPSFCIKSLSDYDSFKHIYCRLFMWDYDLLYFVWCLFQQNRKSTTNYVKYNCSDKSMILRPFLWAEFDAAQVNSVQLQHISTEWAHLFSARFKVQTLNCLLLVYNLNYLPQKFKSFLFLAV